MIKESDLPDLYDRTLMFHDAVEKLTGNGYVRIGLEHFAKPEDDLAKALKNKTAGWNSLGYTAGRYRNIIGIGTGSASTIANNYYFQNTYELKEYKDRILKTHSPFSGDINLTGMKQFGRNLYRDCAYISLWILLSSGKQII